MVFRMELVSFRRKTLAFPSGSRTIIRVLSIDICFTSSVCLTVKRIHTSVKDRASLWSKDLTLLWPAHAQIVTIVASIICRVFLLIAQWRIRCFLWQRRKQLSNEHSVFSNRFLYIVAVLFWLISGCQISSRLCEYWKHFCFFCSVVVWK